MNITLISKINRKFKYYRKFSTISRIIRRNYLKVYLTGLMKRFYPNIWNICGLNNVLNFYLKNLSMCVIERTWQHLFYSYYGIYNLFAAFNGNFSKNCVTIFHSKYKEIVLRKTCTWVTIMVEWFCRNNQFKFFKRWH